MVSDFDNIMHQQCSL